MILQCQTCGTTWEEEDLLDGEGLRHFYSPDQARKIVEPDGKVWEVIFDRYPSIVSIQRCGDCPPILSKCGEG